MSLYHRSYTGAGGWYAPCITSTEGARMHPDALESVSALATVGDDEKVESDEPDPADTADGTQPVSEGTTNGFAGLSAVEVGGSVIPTGDAEDTPEEDEGLTEEDGAAQITDGAIVYLLTSPSYGNLGQGTHVVGVFCSEAEAQAYAENATPEVSDGVVSAWAVE